MRWRAQKTDEPVSSEGLAPLRWHVWLRIGFACFLLAVCLGAYLIRTDLLYGLTIWPSWSIAAVGMFVSGLLLLKTPLRFRIFLFAGWLFLALAFSEEWRTAVRFGLWPTQEWNEARKAGRALRIVSLNCAGGSSSAANEVLAWKPDIVLLQETPGDPTTEHLGRKLFGSEFQTVDGPDGSVIVSGQGMPRHSAVNFTTLEWQGPHGPALVGSVRLTPPVFRVDYWHPECWGAYANNRRVRRAEVRELANRLRAFKGPMIIGGDLNSPPDDGTFAPLLALGLRDSFASAGKGWGPTATNEYPFIRIDQIWLSKHFEPAAVYSVVTENSDHRMVVCDVFVRQ